MRKIHCNYADDGTINHRTQENLGVPRKGTQGAGMLFLQPHRMFVLTSWLLVLTVHAKNQSTSLGPGN